MPLEEPLGLLALLGAIPIIVAYLLRPRKVRMEVPSVIVLFEAYRPKRFERIFKKLVKDTLLPLQLIAILLFALALSGPYIVIGEQVSSENVAIVIDASGSMMADGRFEEALKKAEGYLSAKNTIVVAKSRPMVALEDAPPSEARKVLSGLRCGASSADLSSAILLASEKLPRGEGRIVLISDLSHYRGENPVGAISMARGNGHTVVVDEVVGNGNTDNVGIVDGWIESSEVGHVFHYEVRSYYEPRSVEIEVESGGKKTKTTLNLGADESKFLTTQLSAGISVIRLNVKDSLSADNIAYIYIPSRGTREILFIGNSSSPAFVAMDVMKENYVRSIRRQSSIPSLAGYDVVVVGDEGTKISKELGMMLKAYVESGGKLVVLGSESLMSDMAIEELLPVEIKGTFNETILSVVSKSEVVDGIPFNEISVVKGLETMGKEGSITLVESSMGYPVISYWEFGRGVVVYVGLSDMGGWDDFPTKPEYPIFWLQLLNWLTGIGEAQSYNVKAGMLMPLGSMNEVITPSGKVVTDLLLLDEVGIYTVDDKTYAVNMFDSRESDIGFKSSLEPGVYGGGATYTLERSENRMDLTWIVLAVLGIICVGELFILRGRGEL